MGFFSKRTEKRIAAYQEELLKTHYNEVDNMYKQMRGWRHDYRNHIQTMKVYAANGDLEAIKRYLDLLDSGHLEGLERLSKILALLGDFGNLVSDGDLEVVGLDSSGLGDEFHVLGKG